MLNLPWIVEEMIRAKLESLKHRRWLPYCNWLNMTLENHPCLNMSSAGSRSTSCRCSVAKETQAFVQRIFGWFPNDLMNIILFIVFNVDIIPNIFWKISQWFSQCVSPGPEHRKHGIEPWGTAKDGLEKGSTWMNHGRMVDNSPLIHIYIYTYISTYIYIYLHICGYIHICIYI